MDPALLRAVVASGEFQNVDDLMTDVVNGGSARLLAVWALAMLTNRPSRKHDEHELSCCSFEQVERQSSPASLIRPVARRGSEDLPQKRVWTRHPGHLVDT